MKKILLAMACLSTLFVACTDTEVAEKGLSSDIVSFGTYMGQNTRAAATTTANFNNFGVSAYYSESALWDAGKGNAYCNYMDKDKVTGSVDGWTYNNPKYWPKSGYVNFWAWSPAESKNMTWTADTGVPSFTYTVEDAVADQEDLVVALATDEQKEGGNVSLTFSHLLSKIGFSAKLAGSYPSATVKVTNMEVSYKASTIKNKGVYTYDGSTNWVAAAGDPTYQSATSNSLLGSDPVALNNSTSTPLNDVDNFLMLLPQSAGASALSAKITYTVSYEADGVETTNVKTVDLPSQEWLAGKQYTYNFNISLTDVKFDAIAVTPWSEASVVMIDDKPVAEFAGAPVAVGYAANSTATCATSGIASIDAINTDDYSVTYAKDPSKAISTATGTLTFTAKKENNDKEAKTFNIPVTIYDVLGNKSEVTFTLKQAPKIDILNGATSISGQKQTLVYKSDKGLYSVNGIPASSVSYIIAGVEDASQVVITSNTNPSDFAVSATTTALTITLNTELSTLGSSDEEATVTVTLKDKDDTKIGDYTFNLKQCAKAAMKVNGSVVAAGDVPVINFKSDASLPSGIYNTAELINVKNTSGSFATNSNFTVAVNEEKTSLAVTALSDLTGAGKANTELSGNFILTNECGETTTYNMSAKQYAAAYITRTNIIGTNRYAYKTGTDVIVKEFAVSNTNGTISFGPWQTGDKGGITPGLIKKSMGELMNTPSFNTSTKVLSVSNNGARLFNGQTNQWLDGSIEITVQNELGEPSKYTLLVKRIGPSGSTSGTVD